MVVAAIIGSIGSISSSAVFIDCCTCPASSLYCRYLASSFSVVYYSVHGMPAWLPPCSSLMYLSIAPSNCHALPLPCSHTSHHRLWALPLFMHDGCIVLSHPAPRICVALLETRVRSCAAGGLHTLVLSSSGALYSCGLGSLGRLGIGSEQSVNLPTQVCTQHLGPPSLHVCTRPLYTTILLANAISMPCLNNWHGALLSHTYPRPHIPHRCGIASLSHSIALVHSLSSRGAGGEARCSDRAGAVWVGLHACHWTGGSRVLLGLW